MKKIFLAVFGKPKIIIPLAFIIALGIGAHAYKTIGHVPVVSLTLSDTTARSTESTSNAVDLSFTKAGRLAKVAVKPGDVVHAGDVLATLDAGDALGAVNQAKGALELAKAQYASLDVQYANAKKQQDVLVANAYRNLLSEDLAAVAVNTINDSASIDNNQIPTISGSYSCMDEGSYVIEPYLSYSGTGFSFNVTGLEKGSGNVTYYTPQPLGSCGLFISFPEGYHSNFVKWIVDIPNKKSSSYAEHKNAYDLAVATRDQVLHQLEANLGKSGSTDANIAQATIDAAEGAYETAQAAYKNTLIAAPYDGVVSFVDTDLKVGQSINANKTVITIVKQ